MSERDVIPGFSVWPQGSQHEAYIPTLQNAPQAHAWLSCAHENQGRTRRSKRASSQGASTLGCLIKSTVATRPGVLRKSSEFEAVLRCGLRIASRNFVMRARTNEAGHTRVGIIAGRKVASRAVDRNRGKRLIREAFRISSALIACDVTVQLRSDLRSEHNSTVRAELQQLIATLARRCAATPADSVVARRDPTPNRQ